MAPELWLNGDQVRKLYIYALGATCIVYLKESPPEAERPQRQLWHQHLQTLANEHEIARMLADAADQRPTAREVLDAFFPQSLHASLRTLQNGLASPSFRISSPGTNPGNGTALIHPPVPTPVEWTCMNKIDRVFSEYFPANSTEMQYGVTYPPPRKIPSNRQRQSDIIRSKFVISINEGQKEKSKSQCIFSNIVRGLNRQEY